MATVARTSRARLKTKVKTACTPGPTMPATCCPPGYPKKYSLSVTVPVQEIGQGCCGVSGTDTVAVLTSNELAFNASTKTITDEHSPGRFESSGFVMGMWVTITGSNLNNVVRKVTAVNATTLTLDGSLVDEGVGAPTKSPDQTTITGVRIPECCNYGITPDGGQCHQEELVCVGPVKIGTEERKYVWGNQDAGPRLCPYPKSLSVKGNK